MLLLTIDVSILFLLLTLLDVYDDEGVVDDEEDSAVDNEPADGESIFKVCVELAPIDFFIINSLF